MRTSVWLWTVLLPLAAQTPPKPTPEAVSFYETKVRPVLRANCLACHSQNNRNSGLALDTRAELMAGGNRGPVVKPGNPADSILMHAIEQTGDLKMPPGRKLKDEQIAILRTWIEQGVPWSGDTQAQKDIPAKKPKGWDHWAFQAPKHPTPPQVKDAAWVKNPIDRFILSRLETEQVQPSPEADRYTLLRRVSLDLTGLPPTPKEIQAFLADRSPDAYEKVVDRLLASQHYGERWARHWLDLARYADSDGYTIDDPRPIWKYRDWVINALNRDQPFSQFVIEQLAGDLLPNPTTDQLIATGFHRNTASNYEGGIDFEQYRNEAVADRVATTGTVFLGLTLGCARCHDHKYDPTTQRDFYQIFAYFNNTDEITKESERPDFNRPILALPTAEDKERMREWNELLDRLNRDLVMQARKVGRKLPEGKKVDPSITDLVMMSQMTRRNRPIETSSLIMRELPEPRPAWIHLGGEFTRKGAPVSPASPGFLQPRIEGGNRLDFAKWIVDERNPLTARVTANRIWQAYFGKGIVDTENDFGLMAAKATHPELLDWLATEFMSRGWSQKSIHRLIVTSAAYRQSSRNRPELNERDPYNNLLARQSRFRFEAEIVRDSALVASGLLNPAVGGRSVYPPVPSGSMTGTQVRKPWPTSFGPDRYRRGVYTFAYRSLLYPGLGVFDAPDGAASCTRRVRSNSPLQALTMLNDTSYVEFARSLAKRVTAEAPANDRARLEYGYLLAMGRKPAAAEIDRLARFLALERDEFQTNPASAKLLLGAGDTRTLKEAEEAASAKPGGPQSPRGKSYNDRDVAQSHIELARARAQAEKLNAEISAKPAAEIRELAAWTAVARVLLNLDDFITRN